MHEGRMVIATSSDPDDALCLLLFRQGHLTLREFVDAQLIDPPFDALVDRGVLTRQELARAQVDHSRHIISSLFTWTEGHYRLTDDPPFVKLTFSTPNAILDGIRRIDAWSRIERAIGGMDARYQHASDCEQVAAQLTLSQDELRLVDTSVSRSRLARSVSVLRSPISTCVKSSGRCAWSPQSTALRC